MLMRFIVGLCVDVNVFICFCDIFELFWGGLVMMGLYFVMGGGGGNFWIGVLFFFEVRFLVFDMIGCWWVGSLGIMFL